MFDIAIAQPRLDAHARNAQYFIGERARPIDLVILALVFCLILPSILIAFEYVVGLISERLRNWLHLILVAALSFVIVLPVFARLSHSQSLSVLMAAWLVALAVALMYARVHTIRFFITILSLGILLIPGNFLIGTDVSKIVFASSPDVQTTVINSSTPVVMVVFDELPLMSLLDEQQEIDASRFPNFASLAAGSYWFRNATTVADYTTNAVPAILSGRYPAPDRLDSARDYPENLFTLLSSSYELHVSEPVTKLCPSNLCPEPSPSLSQRWDWLRTAIDSPEPPSEIQSHDRRADFLSFVNSIHDSEKPTLFFKHTVLPHHQWWYLPSGTTYESDSSIDCLRFNDVWCGDEWSVIQAYQRHLLQVGLADTLLGDLLTHLKDTGMYDKSLLVVVADHGVSFHPHEPRRAFEVAHDADLMPVPLLIKLPNQTSGVTSDRNAQTIDVLPSMLDVLNADPPPTIDGHSLFDSSPDPVNKTLIDNKGDRYTLGPTIQGIDDAVRRKAQLFGTSNGWDGVFRVGKYADLVGRSTQQLQVSAPSDVSLELDRQRELANVDVGSTFVPARITGRLTSSGSENQQEELVVAVNGVVRAATRTFREGGLSRFAAMVPEASFRQGRNDVEVFVVSGPVEHPIIRPVTSHRAGE